MVILLKGGDKKNSRYLDASRFLSFFLFPCNLLKRAVYVNDYDRGIVSITLKKERGGIEHECARASAYPRQNAESVHRGRYECIAQPRGSYAIVAKHYYDESITALYTR